MYIQNDALFWGRDYLGQIKSAEVDPINNTVTIETNKYLGIEIPMNEIIVSDPSWIY